MGQSQSLLTDEEKAKQEAENFVNDTRYISWDDKGNLRYGMVHPVKRMQQKLEILQLDFVDDEDGKLWYIMDSSWIASWLAYVHFDMKVAPAPGPCYNNRLITYDYADRRYVFRFALQMAIQDRGGDYRRVSPEVWAKFKEFYPKSGPAITMTFNASEKRNDGFYDPSIFTIVDAVEPPEDAHDDEKANKKKKKKLFAFKKKQEAEEKEAIEKAEKEAAKKLIADIQAAETPISNSNNGASERPSSRMRDSDDDSDVHDDADGDAADNRRLLSGKKDRKQDSDDDSDDEVSRNNNNNNNNNNNKINNNNKNTSQGSMAALMKSSTRVELKSGNATSGGYQRVTESTASAEAKDDLYYEKIYLS